MGTIKNIYVGYKNYLTGKTTPEEKQRLAICNRCEFKKPNAPIHWCMKCPCHMPAKIKSPKAHCKIKRW